MNVIRSSARRGGVLAALIALVAPAVLTASPFAGTAATAASPKSNTVLDWSVYAIDALINAPTAHAHDRRGRRAHLVEQARLFAMLNMAAADSLINCWSDKAFFSFWRPITADHALVRELVDPPTETVTKATVGQLSDIGMRTWRSVATWTARS
jgi:hypothetical protein